ncbi:hypothetical protein DI272_25735 [Streptomyces sp. Act143]|uniref:hypothetical protein n=1 Tax=Streptomyces sp. Act143 TaxID=2200760 RepID=UPI000D67F656|nr:hypothetical protein [Streptomyces sp. Act143]PWI17183.1 hypothetical protein DI272_25735 [Streptomyces sp. Act143]
MAFGAEELRVLRRALALALHPRPASAEDVQDCLRLADSLDEAMREGARLRAFLVADLARYRDALPGTAAGYLALLEEALSAGYHPNPDDLAGLRALRGNPTAAALLDRCQRLAEQDVRARLARGTARRVTPAVPASRTRLLALPGGLSAVPESSGDRHADSASGSGAGGFGAPSGGRHAVVVGEASAAQPEKPAAPAKKPADEPAPGSEPPKPNRPIPTPGEVFPRRKPTPPPPASPPQQLAAG